jgi:hypothetical protein
MGVAGYFGQGVDVLRDLKINISASAPVPSVGPPVRHELFPAKGRAAVPAASGPEVDIGGIYEIPCFAFLS